LWEGIGPRVVDAVVDRTLHFGVDTRSTLPARPHADLVFVPLFSDVHVVVRARRRPAATAPLFYVPRIAPSERVLAGLRARGRVPGRVVPCGDLELVKSLVRHGAGIGILPWRVAMQDTPRGELRLVDARLPHEADAGMLFYRADLHRTRAAMVLRDEILRRGRELDGVTMPCGVPRVTRAAAR
jgi:DNA-binding transcriptional LysR family regulator